MRLLQSEYLLKGVYLGLVLIAALYLAAIPDTPENASLLQQGFLRVNLATLALHREAHAKCFVARSVKCPVTCEPSVTRTA